MDIDQRVEEIRGLSIHEKSRKQYNSANTQFLIYLMSENPSLITTALQQKVVGKSTHEIKKSSETHSKIVLARQLFLNSWSQSTLYNGFCHYVKETAKSLELVYLKVIAQL